MPDAPEPHTQNPYAAPNQLSQPRPTWGGPAPGEHRSTVPKGIGTLSLVFGALQVTLGTGLGYSKIVAALHQGDLGGTAPSALPWFVLLYGLGGLALMLLPLGWGQLRYKHWALAGSRMWSLAALLALAGTTVAVWVSGPIIAALFWTLGAVVLYAPFPLAMLWFFYRPAVSTTMVG